MPPNRRGIITSRAANPRAAVPDRKGKRRQTVCSHPPIPTQGAIETTSDGDEDEDPRPPPKGVSTKCGSPPTNVQDHEASLSRKDQEIEKLREREKELELIVAMQKKEIEANVSQEIPRGDKIKEELNCDICTTMMWTPYLLTECGHTFCHSCLLSWFDGITARFLRSYPGYKPLPPRHMRFLRYPLHSPLDSGMLYMDMDGYDSPHYACPLCQADVTRRPVEDFKVKALVSWFGSVQGVEPPEGGPQPGTGDTLFDGYFLL